MTGEIAANILDYAPAWPNFSLGGLVVVGIRLLYIVGGVGFLVVLLLGGIMFITSGGDKINVQRSQLLLTNAFAGIVLLAGAGAAAYLTQQILGIQIFGLHTVTLPRPGPPGGPPEGSEGDPCEEHWDCALSAGFLCEGDQCVEDTSGYTIWSDCCTEAKWMVQNNYVWACGSLTQAQVEDGQCAPNNWEFVKRSHCISLFYINPAFCP